MRQDNRRTPTSTARTKAQSHVVILIILATGYLCGFMVFRWLRGPLSKAFDPFFKGGGAVSPSEGFALMVSACLPLVLWAVLFYALWRTIPRRAPAILVAGVVWLALVFIEGDLAWYTLSHQHAGLTDVLLLATSDIIGDWSVDPHSVFTLLLRMGKHAAALIILWIVAWALARKYHPRVPGSFATLVLVVFLLAIVDSVFVGYALSEDNREWRVISNQNPVRLRTADRMFERLFRSDEDLDRANAALTALRRVPTTAVETPSSATATEGPHKYDVLLLMVESLNPWYIDSTTMPFWTALSARTSRWQQHYSTGNATEYGVLGLLFGSPVSFYRGNQYPPTTQPGSPYIDRFVDHGYDTRVVSWELSCYADVGAYLQNFTRSPYETRDDWALIPIIAEELGRPGPQLVLSLYNGPHIPYRHQPQYTAFDPEVPDSFDFLSSGLSDHVEEIRNRYRNTLRELDDWLATLLAAVDLSRTIVVIAGDHGEELFEQGRLGHIFALEEAQTRTPLLIHAPEIDPTTIESITSHADVMPTLMDLLGWPDVPGTWGTSVLDTSRFPAAIIARARSIRPPNTWVVVTPGAKSKVLGSSGDELQLSKLLDHHDQDLRFDDDPARWHDNFAQVLRFERLPPPAKPGKFGKRWSTCDK